VLAAIAGDATLFTTDPILAIATLKAKLKANSLPSNQSLNMVELATEVLVSPQPNKNRPRNINGQDFSDKPKQNTMCPTANVDVNTSKHDRTPRVSTEYPPKNGKITLGKAGNE
jgi:hypothetical protein